MRCWLIEYSRAGLLGLDKWIGDRVSTTQTSGCEIINWLHVPSVDQRCRKGSGRHRDACAVACEPATDNGCSKVYNVIGRAVLGTTHAVSPAELQPREWDSHGVALASACCPSEDRADNNTALVVQRLIGTAPLSTVVKVGSIVLLEDSGIAERGRGRHVQDRVYRSIDSGDRLRPRDLVIWTNASVSSTQEQSRCSQLTGLHLIQVTPKNSSIGGWSQGFGGGGGGGGAIGISVRKPQS